MDKTFNIVFNANANTDEITDSIADVFGIAHVIEDKLSDGFQLEDVLAAIQLQPRVMEVINDFPVFVSQFKQLSGSTALMAVQKAKERSVAEIGDLGKIGTFVYDLLIQMAQTFNFIESTVIAGIGQLEQWKTLVGGLKEAPAA